MTISTFALQFGTHPANTDQGCATSGRRIARRRMAGHVGLIATLVLLAFLIVIGAPPVTRLLVVLPAAVSASGYLQARLKFCAGFGSRGIFNFGSVGETVTVADAEAKAMDRRRSRQISLWAFAIGGIVGVVAVLLPV